MRDIFISYAKEDKLVARKLIQKLESQNYSCFIYPRDITNSSDKKSEINKAVEESNLFLLVLSDAAEKSNSINEELKFAVENEKNVIPIVTGKTSNSLGMNYLLNSLEWVDIYNDGFDSAYEVLVEIIEEFLDGNHILRTAKITKQDGGPNPFYKNPVFIVFAVIIAVLLIYLLMPTSDKTPDINKNTKVITNVESVSGISDSDKKLVGKWKVIDYFDSMPGTKEEKDKAKNGIIKNGVMIFGANKVFQRIGFSPRPQKGTWVFDEQNKKISLKANNSVGVMNLSEFSEKRMVMMVNEQVNDPKLGKFVVTTKITFEKQ